MDKVTVYDQKYLMCEKLFEINSNGNLENLKENIKRNLELAKIRDKSIDKKYNEFKDWDGFVDIKSKRDGNLKRLL